VIYILVSIIIFVSCTKDLLDYRWFCHDKCIISRNYPILRIGRYMDIDYHMDYNQHVELISIRLLLNRYLRYNLFEARSCCTTLSDSFHIEFYIYIYIYILVFYRTVTFQLKWFLEFMQNWFDFSKKFEMSSAPLEFISF